MGQKDILEKSLINYPEIVADIINVFEFNGEQIVKSCEIKDRNTKRSYFSKDFLKELERDVSKTWNNNFITICCFGFENQTTVDKNMPIRAMLYDSVEYKAQILEHPNQKPVAVFTYILYFGIDKPWIYPKSLEDIVTVPEILKKSFFNYPIRIINIGFLTDEQINQCHSDLKYVALLLRDLRLKKDISLLPTEISHAKEVILLLSQITGDISLKHILDSVDIKEGKDMIQAWKDQLALQENKGFSKGKTKNRNFQKSIQRKRLYFVYR